MTGWSGAFAADDLRGLTGEARRRAEERENVQARLEANRRRREGHRRRIESLLDTVRSGSPPSPDADPDAEEPPPDDQIIRAKWTMDDAATLSEAAAKLRAYADALDQLEREGWHLVGPVEDDYGFIINVKP